jgi:hypothetical protein
MGSVQASPGGAETPQRSPAAPDTPSAARSPLARDSYSHTVSGYRVAAPPTTVGSVAGAGVALPPPSIQTHLRVRTRVARREKL